MGIGNGEFVLRRKGIRVTAGVCGGEREMGNEEGERLEE
jgi:hypothetical protein